MKDVAQSSWEIKPLGEVAVIVNGGTPKSKVAELGVELEAMCNSAIKSYEASLQDLDDLRQSLLQKAFAGELT